jgi:hypothetical protein
MSADQNEPTIVNLAIGERGNLTRSSAKRNARAFREIVARYPWAEIWPTLDGFHDDPRGLWEVPEVRAYLCRWAQFAGINSSADADALKIDVNMCGVLQSSCSEHTRGGTCSGCLHGRFHRVWGLLSRFAIECPTCGRNVGARQPATHAVIAALRIVLH